VATEIGLLRRSFILCWHRELFRWFWKRKSMSHSRKPRLSPETISLIKEMAASNRLWGAERIRGELLKLDMRVSKRTIQKYMRHIRRKRPGGQTWKTFLRNHAAEVWACDFLQVTDLWVARTAAGGDSVWTIANIADSGY
jgi:putative transposase